MALVHLEEGVRRDPELEAQQLLVDAAVAGHQLTRQVLQVGGRPGSESGELQPCLYREVATGQQTVQFSPLTLSHKVQRGHAAVLALALCEVGPHGALQGGHLLLVQFLFRVDEISVLTVRRRSWWVGGGAGGLTCGWKKTMAMACLVLVVRTVSCFQWPSYVSGLYTEYGVVLHTNTENAFILKF